METNDIVTITPELAKMWLTTLGNRSNRALSRNRIRDYVQQMKAGTWICSGESAICFGSDGRLMNGHHRLKAVIESGCSVTMYVRRNVEHAMLQFIDTQRRRSNRDIGKMFGYDTFLDDGLRTIHRAKTSQPYVTTLELDSLRLKYEPALVSVQRLKAIRIGRFALTAGVKAGMILAAKRHGTKIDQFLDDLSRVACREATEPKAIVNLVRWIENRRGDSGTAYAFASMEATLRAFEQWLSGSENHFVRASGRGGASTATTYLDE